MAHRNLVGTSSGFAILCNNSNVCVCVVRVGYASGGDRFAGAVDIL